MSKVTVIDLFCGAGGFSEGFRQQGFTIIYGIDKWEPAIATFNHNFNLNCTAKDILKLSNDLEEIENLPDSDIIIGSPPCVSFSNSNKSGKADKSLGVQLTEAFFRIIAIKKNQPNSTLKAWYMENVPNSLKYLKRTYSFKDLGLEKWALNLDLIPTNIVINLQDNSFILNSAEYGAVQSRKRVITGENIKQGYFRKPERTNSIEKKNYNNQIPSVVKLGDIKSKIPSPYSSKSKRIVYDPVYTDIKIPVSSLTDHFYDSGLYECQWKDSLFMKRNHPFMGKMAFPENEYNPSRTITATNIGTSRESIIYKSEINRVGDGEYRCPTIREMASIMGFPYTYQFKGNSVNTKARLVGNAVCVSVSRAIARQLRNELSLKKINKPIIQKKQSLEGIYNLNTFTQKVFINPPKKKVGSRFRRHPFKDGNMTVTLSNYNISRKTKGQKKWYTSIQYGNGHGYPTNNYNNNYYKKIKPIILEQEKGDGFLKVIDNEFSHKIPKGAILQKMYENRTNEQLYKNPVNLIEEVSIIIDRLQIEGLTYKQNGIKIFKHKDSVPLKQLFALYAINKISSIANEF